jgi:hypothetical protein
MACPWPRQVFLHWKPTANLRRARTFILLRMWLGQQPADGALKNALLGRAV